MIDFRREGRGFGVRASGVVMHQGQVLLSRAVQDNFWSLPGGRCELMESSEDAVRREMREELGCDVQVDRLLWTAETLYRGIGGEYHQIGFYYLVSLPDGCRLSLHPGPHRGSEGSVELTMQWFPADALWEVVLYPTFLRSALGNLPAQSGHVVTEDSPGKPLDLEGPIRPAPAVLE